MTQDSRLSVPYSSTDGTGSKRMVKEGDVAEFKEGIVMVLNQNHKSV